MYTLVLLIHSWVRWIALVCGFGATLAALMGRTGADGARDSVADRWGMFLVLTLDLQMLLGLMLYLGLSPNMQEILNHFGESMKCADTRFYAVEHITAMFAAIVLSHLGRILARKAATPAAKRTLLLITFGLALLLMFAGMPWPGRPGGRDLFRL